MHRVVSKCACGVEISHNSAFPPDHKNEWGTKTSLHCKKCWESHVNGDLIPQIAQEEARNKKQRQFKKAVKRQNQTKDGEPKKKKKAKKKNSM